MSNQDNVPASERTLRILERIVASQTGLTAAQLTNSLSIPRSAVYNLLNTLIRMNYVIQEEPRKPYLPGPRLWNLNPPTTYGTRALITAFRTETKRSDSEETFALAILSGVDTIIVAETPSKHTVRCVIPAGKRDNAATHPAGWVLLAGIPQTTLTQMLKSYGNALSEKLSYIRSNAIIIDKKSEITTIAAPICPDGQCPQAALLLCCPTFRCPSQQEHTFINMVYETAARISHRLGARLYQPYNDTGIHSQGESIPMSQAELTEFLKGPWAARLACIRKDGTPHVVPIWYEWQDNSIIIIAWPHSVWASLVIKNPLVALSIDEPWPPMRRVMIRGEAKCIPQQDVPGGIDELRSRISSRYTGAANTPPKENIEDSGMWSAFRIIPQQCIALKQKQS